MTFPTLTIARAIFYQACPIILSQFAINGLFIADVIFISHISAQESAALAVGNTIFNTTTIFFVAILFSLTPIISKLCGTQRRSTITHTIHQGIYLTALLSLLIMTLLSFPDAFIQMSQLNPSTEAIARRYLWGVVSAIPAFMLFQLFTAYVAGTRRPKITMYINIAGFIIKWPLAYICVYGFRSWEGLGALGCSLSSSIILWAQAIVAVWLVYRDDDYDGSSVFKKWKTPDWKIQWQILKIGIPVGFGVFVEYTTHTMIALFIARLGNVVMAGHQIASNLAYMAYGIAFSLGIATSALVSYAIGTANNRLALTTAWVAVKLIAVVAILFMISFCAGNVILVGLYTADLAIHKVAIPLIVMAGIYHFFDALVTVFLGILRACNKTLVPACISGIALWVVGLGGGYFLAFDNQQGLGAIGFWISITIAQVLSFSLIGFYLWKISKTLLFSQTEEGDCFQKPR